MKAPLFFWLVICLVCVFSGCEKARCYYHCEVPCGKVYGNVKKVTDTLYHVVNGEMTYPFKTNEYHFDSLNRMVEMQHCIYGIERDGKGREIAVSVIYQQRVKYRYDRDGRRIERDMRTCLYPENGAETERILERLVLLEGNNEKWEVTMTDSNGEVSTTEMYCQYEKDRILVDMADGAQRKKEAVHIFDDRGNLIESQHIGAGDGAIRIKNRYDKNNQLVKTTNELMVSSDEINWSRYELDEYDNEGNWLKRTEHNEDKESLNFNITRRRIEYRLP